MVSLTSFIMLALPLSTYAAMGPRADLRILNKVIAPDGFSRSAVLVNGQFPAPLIKGNKGDKFKLNVINSLTDNTMVMDTSIHWHGLFQKGTNWADGRNHPDCSVDMQFMLVPDQAGTFWYHSHLSTQYCDGLGGPLVVYDPKDPHKYMMLMMVKSTVLSIGDWCHLPAPEITGVPHPDATTFNGIGRSLNGDLIPLYVMNVIAGKRYRTRLVNIACDPHYTFFIDGHNLTIIEADGENTEPWTVDSLQIFAGQRYSFILHANQRIDNYWIRANPDRGDPGFTNGTNSAVLPYRGAPEVEPITNDTSTRLLNEADLRPLTNPRAPGRPGRGNADINILLNFGLDPNNLVFTVNGTAFVPPPTPVLLQILSGVYDAHDLLPNGSVYTLEPNKVVELTMPGLQIAGPHPIHLHGHAFSVIRSAGSSHDNYDNPVRRDVVSIGDTGDLVTIRFETDNSGPWFLHCHIDWHLDIDFAYVFAEDPKHTKAKNPVSKSWEQLCPLYNNSPHPKLTAGSNPSHRLIPG